MSNFDAWFVRRQKLPPPCKLVWHNIRSQVFYFRDFLHKKGGLYLVFLLPSFDYTRISCNFVTPRLSRLNNFLRYSLYLFLYYFKEVLNKNKYKCRSIAREMEEKQTKTIASLHRNAIDTPSSSLREPM